ncbi:MAG: hypothetical protein ABJN42_26860 [Roseibium sp.]|uniref:hypothetical protein n=1 Tax=Roseibium sp. TaxID=1936156 RepID=UPI0032971BB4
MSSVGKGVALGDDSPLEDKGDKSPAQAGIATSVLDDPIFRVLRVNGSQDRLTLPGLLLALSEDDVTSLIGVRAHQAHTVHMFLAQLVSLAGPDTDPDEASWKTALLSVCPDLKAWQITPAPGEYGFMQPAIPDGVHLKKASLTVSGIDLLQISNMHNVKLEASAPQEDDVWLWHLITLQTGGGFPGMTNYGAFRMNGGWSSRSLWAVYDRSWGLGRRVFEDARLILTDLDKGALYGFSPEGLKLMWTASWEEGERLSAGDLDYRVIEVCRRVQLERQPSGALMARVGNSKKPRTALAESTSPQFLRGVCGDIWAPIDTSKADLPKATSMVPAGTQYENIAKTVIHGADTSINAPAAVLRSVPDPVLHVAGVANGQGKTGGLHRRQIDFGKMKKSGLGLSSPTLGSVASMMIEQAEVLMSTLRYAIAAYAGKNVNNEVKNRYLDLAREAVDNAFFDYLPRAAAAGGNYADWVSFLYRLGEAVLEDVFAGVPVKATQRMRLTSSATGAYHGMFWSEKRKGPTFEAYKEKIMNTGKGKNVAH